MTFVEKADEVGEANPTKISFWANEKRKIFFEMQPDYDADQYEYQCMSLGKDDVEKMIAELKRILDEYEVD